jgi:hypothetical protein
LSRHQWIETVGQRQKRQPFGQFTHERRSNSFRQPQRVVSRRILASEPGPVQPYRTAVTGAVPADGSHERLFRGLIGQHDDVGVGQQRLLQMIRVQNRPFSKGGDDDHGQLPAA